MNGGVGRFPWQCSIKGQNKVALYLELECSHYTISGVTDPQERENDGEHGSSLFAAFC